MKQNKNVKMNALEISFVVAISTAVIALGVIIMLYCF